MNRTISFEVTDELMLSFLRYHFGFTNFLRGVATYILLASVVMVLALRLGVVAGQIALLLLFGLAFAGTGYYWYTYRNNRMVFLAALANRPDRTQNYIFTDDCLEGSGPMCQGKLIWQELAGVERSPELWSLRFDSRFFLIPAALVDQEIAGFIERQAINRSLPTPNAGSGNQRSNLPSNRRTLAWLAFLAVVVAVLVWLGPRDGRQNSDGQKPYWQEKVIVEQASPRLVRLAVPRGRSIDLAIDVLSGAAVDVRVGLSSASDDDGVKKVVVETVEDFAEKQVRQFRRQVSWPHTEPVTILVSSSERSEVYIRAELLPEMTGKQ